tara:strand:- start:179 stop:475 length:297 start_codon:yes stop_codon:yes gene_type:complete
MSWTPITEKMPPAGKLVLLKQQAENWEPFVIIGKFVPAKTEEDDGPDSDFTEACDYDEEKEVWYWPEGFYERIANWDEFRFVLCEAASPVIEWMEIPE